MLVPERSRPPRGSPDTQQGCVKPEGTSGRREGGVAAPSLSPKIWEAAVELGAPAPSPGRAAGSYRSMMSAMVQANIRSPSGICRATGKEKTPAGISPRQDLTPVGSPKKTEKLGKRAVEWHRPPRPRAHPELASRPFLNPLTPPVRPASRGNKLEVLITCRAGKRRFPSVYFKPAPHHANVRPRCKEEGIIIP